jgi:hypothetical protein
MDAERFSRAVAALAGEGIEERERASSELTHPAAWASLRKALAAAATPEVRGRIEGIIKDIETGSSQSMWRWSRAAQALEWMGTPEARRVLERLGTPDAEGAVARMKARAR